MTDQKSYRERSEKQMKQRRVHIILFGVAAVLCIIIVILSIQLWKVSKNKNEQQEVNTSSDNIIEPTPEPDTAKEPEKEDKEDKDDKEDKAEKENKVERIRKDLDPDKPMIALTFDDGPYDKVTNRILKVLKDNNGRATFFVIGNRLSTYHDVMEKAYEQGNQIGNHTYTHDKRTLNGLKPKKARSEVAKVNKLVKKYIGKKPGALRPTYGAANSSVCKMVKKMGMVLICWDVDSEDWKSRDKKKILKRMKSLQDGDIVLMHDLYDSTAEAVEELVPKLTKKGYQLVTIDELFYYKEMKQKPGQIYYMVR